MPRVVSDRGSDALFAGGLALAVAFLVGSLGLSCSSSSNPGNHDGAAEQSSGGGSGGAQPHDDAAADTAATNDSTCLDIRLCAAACNDNDVACMQTCIARGTTEAQSLFQTLAACTLAQCPNHDFYCGCDQQCPEEGACFAETMACLGGATSDLLCSSRCVGQ